MIETILGAIFVFGLFLFTAYGLPKMGYKMKGKRFVNNYIPKKNTKTKCLCHCHNGHGGCFGMVVDGKEYNHVYCEKKCVHCSQEKNRP